MGSGDGGLREAQKSAERLKAVIDLRTPIGDPSSGCCWGGWLLRSCLPFEDGHSLLDRLQDNNVFDGGGFHLQRILFKYDQVGKLASF